MLIRGLLNVGLGCALLGGSPVAFAVTVGQQDTFEDGTTQGWQINVLNLGAPPPEALPANVSSGGPGGVDDNYLRLTSLGTLGAGGRLSAINLAQWSGDYLNSGVQAIRMDLNNFGNSDLFLRLLFADPIPGPPQNQAVSTDAVFVPGGSGWVSILFPIGPADLTSTLGSVEAALGNVTELRLFHSPTAVFPGPPVTAQLGVDNIQALGVARVPDIASTSMLLCFAILALALVSWPRGRMATARTL